MLAVVFVCNAKYFDKFVETCTALIDVGEYKGDIVLVIGDDICEEDAKQHAFIKSQQIIVHKCPDITFANFATMTETNTMCGKTGNKLFQYHKYHLFTTFFKRWDTIFYIDAGAKIFNNIHPILDCATETKDALLAHSDAYPTYQWKMSGQFRGDCRELSERWDLERDYFQSTIMLFDTSIIEEDTFRELCDLTEKYPTSGTNDQGILNLYFVCIKNKWRQIPMENDDTYFYDFNIRKNDKPYIMTKYFVFND